MIPPDQAEIAAADGVDIRTHGRKPLIDYDIIEDERVKKCKHQDHRKKS